MLVFKLLTVLALGSCIIYVIIFIYFFFGHTRKEKKKKNTRFFVWFWCNAKTFIRSSQLDMRNRSPSVSIS